MPQTLPVLDAPPAPGPAPGPAPAPAPEPPRPLGLVAELTYQCPLHCPYCSNPAGAPAGPASGAGARKELDTGEWSRVLRQAADLGVIHALFSGGEPLVRTDLAALVGAARGAGMYTNLITSAVGLTRDRVEELKTAGLDSVQISFQADEAGLADAIAGTRAHHLKLEAARFVREAGLPLTVNVVLHRANIDRLDRIIDLAASLSPVRLELANTQFYGWAHRNRSALLPTRPQVERAGAAAAAAKQRLKGGTEVLYVPPDYFEGRPKPCMNGWGRRYIAVNPAGDVLPCPTAFEVRSLRFDNARDRDLGWIWLHSEAFNAFRGSAWMTEPCRSCDRREVDFGGCRCQAALLTGDASNTDPACALSPHHERMGQIVGNDERAAGRCGELPAPLWPRIRRTNP